MPDAPMDNETLLRRTLVTAGAMVGACVVIVGTLTLIASVLVGHAVAPAGEGSAAASAAPPNTPRLTPNILRPPSPNAQTMPGR
ncbi:MAG: hypothetical protein ACLP1X_05635 [Polyangiaceae bacterium]|jgi:hypothetical protein